MHFSYCFYRYCNEERFWINPKKCFSLAAGLSLSSHYIRMWTTWAGRLRSFRHFSNTYKFAWMPNKSLLSVSVSYTSCAWRVGFTDCWCSIFQRLVFFQSFMSASVTSPRLLLCIPSLFCQQETQSDNSRWHKADCCPHITNGKSFSFSCLYLSSCCLICVSLFVWLLVSAGFFLGLSAFIYPDESCAELACSSFFFFNNVLFHIRFYFCGVFLFFSEH